MIYALLKITKENTGAIIAGLIIIGLAAWIVSYERTIADLEAERAKCKVELSDYKAAYQVLAAKAQEQNRAINQIKSETAQKLQAGAKAKAYAENRAIELKQQAQWLSEQLNKPSYGKTCGDALKEWRNG